MISRETGCACALERGLEKMADFAEQSVQTRIRRLCQCILDESFRTPYECDILLSSLQPPGKNTVWNERRMGKYIRRLSQATFDILLLRKWAWFGSWGGTPLSPLCWCRAYSYGYHTRGREREGKRLCAALDTFSSESESTMYISLPLSFPPPLSLDVGCSVLVERDAVLQFLALLAGDINHQQPQVNSVLAGHVNDVYECLKKIMPMVRLPVKSECTFLCCKFILLFIKIFYH